MTQHLLLKFHYFWETSNGEVNTLDEHMALIKKHGSCWWGRTSSIAQSRADQLQVQLDAGTETFIFLYSIWVPRRVHEDKTLWFVGRLQGISLERPRDTHLIPAYYRDLNLDSYFLLSEITPFAYAPGSTPKVPGQAAIRYMTVEGPPCPENIRFDSDERKGSGKQFIRTEVSALRAQEPEGSTVEGLQSKIIDLQADVIRMQELVAELRTYKDYYQKILNTDYLFSSEKFFESWIQENIHKILPELEIIDRQPNAKWSDGKFGRLDLLALNKETKDLCIIEVKTRKRSKHSGYDQFVRYTSWARRCRELLARNYADFGLMPSDEPAFVIITDYVDEEMRSICSDHGITLIRVFGGLSFEKVA